MATGRKSPCQVEPRLWLSSLTAGIASVNTIPTWRPPMRMMDPLQWSVMRRNGGAVPLSRNSGKPLMRYQPPHGQMWAMQELGLTWPGGGGPKQRAHLMKRPYMAPLGCWNCSSDYKLICSFAHLRLSSSAHTGHCCTARRVSRETTYTNCPALKGTCWTSSMCWHPLLSGCMDIETRPTRLQDGMGR